MMKANKLFTYLHCTSNSNLDLMLSYSRSKIELFVYSESQTELLGIPREQGPEQVNRAIMRHNKNYLGNQCFSYD